MGELKEISIKTVVDFRATWHTFKPKLKKVLKKYTEKIYYIFFKKRYSYISGKSNSCISENRTL